MIVALLLGVVDIGRPLSLAFRVPLVLLGLGGFNLTTWWTAQPREGEQD